MFQPEKIIIADDHPLFRLAEYAGLSSGQITVTGTINTCFGHPEFLQNSFELKDKASYLEFSASK